MSQSIRKILVFLSVIGMVTLLQACEDASSASGGGGGTVQLVDLNERESTSGQESGASSAAAVAETQAEESSASEAQAVAAVTESTAKASNEAVADTKNAAAPDNAAAIETAAAAAAASEARTKPRGEFHILIDQSHMACHECGLNFDSADLIIDHSAGRYKHHQTGGLHIKKGPYRQARFRANLSSIPLDAEILKATLHMRLNKGEGIANKDHSSEYVVKGYVDGRLIQIKTFNVQNDIKGRGYSKGLNPVVPFDYTRYAKML